MVDYSSLLAQLEKIEWPSVYMFKFIVPVAKEEEVKKLLDYKNITSKTSSNGTYISVTSTVMMPSPDKVIEVYQKASQIEGIITL